MSKVLIACDLSQIEVRVLHWLARNKSMLDAMRDGYNPYEATAIQLGIWSGKKGSMKKENLSKYQAIKSITLGCGFGIGAERFMQTAPTLSGGQWTPTAAEAREAVSLYREKNPKIVALWKTLQNNLETASKSPDHELRIKLPSGRALYYREVRKDGDGLTGLIIKSGKWVRAKLYGGLLAENCTQALAREIFVYHMAGVDKQGMDLALHTHDELVIREEEHKATETQTKLLGIMRTPPPWIPDIPMDAEAQIMDFYKK